MFCINQDAAKGVGRTRYAFAYRPREQLLNLGNHVLPVAAALVPQELGQAHQRRPMANRHRVAEKPLSLLLVTTTSSKLVSTVEPQLSLVHAGHNMPTAAQMTTERELPENCPVFPALTRDRQPSHEHAEAPDPMDTHLPHKAERDPTHPRPFRPCRLHDPFRISVSGTVDTVTRPPRPNSSASTLRSVQRAAFRPQCRPRWTTLAMN